MLSAIAITELHDELTERWHEDTCDADDDSNDDWLRLVARQHRANFELWHIEDEARTPGATEAELADVKRRVDTDQPAAQRPGRAAGPGAARLASGSRRCPIRKRRSIPSRLA
jgi:hypothetical protein